MRVRPSTACGRRDCYSDRPDLELVHTKREPVLRRAGRTYGLFNAHPLLVSRIGTDAAAAAAAQIGITSNSYMLRSLEQGATQIATTPIFPWLLVANKRQQQAEDHTLTTKPRHVDLLPTSACALQTPELPPSSSGPSEAEEITSQPLDTLSSRRVCANTRGRHHKNLCAGRAKDKNKQENTHEEGSEQRNGPEGFSRGGQMQRFPAHGAMSPSAPSRRPPTLLFPFPPTPKVRRIDLHPPGRRCPPDP